MQDRYLFRAKRLDNGEWVQGALLDGENHCLIGQEIKFSPYTEHECKIVGHEVDRDTICQCTGLKDKNGNLIWENDVVRFQFDNDDCPFPNKDTKKRIGKVFFSDFRASWSIAMGRKCSKALNNDLFKYVQNGNRVEVIGSAFDNPELLESED